VSTPPASPPEQAVRRELIARRRYLPQFVGAVRGEFAS
jgi:hypothetical protein